MDGEPNSERIITPMPKSLVEAVDDYRFAKRKESRAEAIRHLLRLALKVEGRPIPDEDAAA